MKNADIKELSDKDLLAKIKEERQQLTKMNFTHAVSPLDNPRTISENKKTIARLLTEQRKRLIAKAQ